MKKVLSVEETTKLIHLYEGTWKTVDEMAAELCVDVDDLSKEINILKDEGRLSSDDRKEICKRNLMKAVVDLTNIGFKDKHIRFILGADQEKIGRYRREAIKSGMVDDTPHTLSPNFNLHTVIRLRGRGVPEKAIRQYAYMPNNDLHVLIGYVDEYCKDKMRPFAEETHKPKEYFEGPSINVNLSLDDIYTTISALQLYMERSDSERSFITIEKLINKLSSIIPDDHSSVNVDEFYDYTLKLDSHTLKTIGFGVSRQYSAYDIYSSESGFADINVDGRTLCRLFDHYKRYNRSLKGFIIDNPYLVDNEAIIKGYKDGKSIPAIAAENNTTEGIVGFTIWRYQNKSTDTDAKEVNE